MIWLYLPAVVLAGLCALSLFAKIEGFRGSGRVAGGLSTVLLALFLLLSLPGQPAIFAVLSAALLLTGLVTVGSGAVRVLKSTMHVSLLLTGLVTVGSGARKFLRRKSQAASPS